MNRATAAVCLLCLVSLSCAPKRTVLLLDTRSVTADRLVELVSERAAKLQTLTGTGSLMFDGPDLSGSASFELALRRPDSALIRLEGPFGIDIATVFLTRSSYTVYNSMANTVTSGSPQMGALRGVLPVDLSVDQLMDAFSGAITIPSGVPLRYEVDGDRFLLAYKQLNGVATYRVDPEQIVVTGFALSDSAGTVIAEMTATRLKEYDGFSLPRSIRLHLPPSDSEIAIAYSRQEPNGPSPSFVFSVPRSARRFER
jgi:hypothetical protein